VAVREVTVARIVEALVVAAERLGADKVSVTDVCKEAGISRGTLYRYFPTREHLLAAIDVHFLGLYRRVVTEAVERDPAVERRISVVVRAFASLPGDGTAFRRFSRSEPARVLQHLSSNWEDIVAVLRDALAPAYPESSDDLDVLADIAARHLFSKQLVPSDHTSVEALIGVLEAFAGAPSTHRS
jgi:AcrR family transcriptional regulator